MEFTKVTVADKSEERIHIALTEDNPLISRIEALLEESDTKIIGSLGKETKQLPLSLIECFISEGGKTYAVTEAGKYLLKTRLYVIEELLDSDFIRINKSAIANIGKIERFEVSFQGGLNAVFKSGYVDYVSRRNLRSVKERLGF